jgi:membrane-associated phospholipid phosphatase
MLKRREKMGKSFMPSRRAFLASGAALALAPRVAMAAPAPRADRVLVDWYRMVLELVRHTATYSPPVASRSFALIGIIAHEAMAATTRGLRSLAVQLTDLTAVPVAAGDHDGACVLHGALTAAVRHLFQNTGPTGQRAMDAMGAALDGIAADGVAPGIATASVACGQGIAAHVLAWAATDGGEVVTNMGFPMTYALGDQPGAWRPTSKLVQQQLPLLPGWGDNRPFAMAAGQPCQLAQPMAYSDEPGSDFWRAAEEVMAVKAGLTDDQKLIARFWSDDPMLSPTPPGHWIAITLQIIRRDSVPADRAAGILAKLGIAMADAFIANWHTKYTYDTLRPVTYIRAHFDPNWEPLLITPPFPEYPSGHSTQSGAAAAVLTAVFGEGFAFTDETHVDEGLPARDFPDFHAAAAEAALSRLYGGIHFRQAIEDGLVQGACVGAYAAALVTG